MSGVAVGLGVFALAVVGFGLWLGLRPTKCPSCRRGLVEHPLHDGGLGFRCARCNIDYRRTEDMRLVSVEAYELGATEPPPEARLAGRRRAQQ